MLYVKYDENVHITLTPKTKIVEIYSSVLADTLRLTSSMKIETASSKIGITIIIPIYCPKNILYQVLLLLDHIHNQESIHSSGK